METTNLGYFQFTHSETNSVPQLKKKKKKKKKKEKKRKNAQFKMTLKIVPD